MDLLTIKMPKCLAVCLVWLVLAVFSVRSSPVVNRVHVLDIPADFPTEDTQVIQNLEFHLRLKRQVTDEKVTTLKPESLTTKPDVSPSPKENDDSVDASGLSAVDNNGKNLPSTAKIPGVSPQNLGSDAATNVDLPVEHTTTRTSLTSAAQVGDSLDAGEGKQDYSMTSALPDLKPAGRVESLSGLGNSSPEQTTHSVTSTTTAALVTPAEEHRAAPIEAPPKAGNKTDITTVAPEAVGDVDMAPPPPATAPAHVVTTPESPITAPLTIAGPLNNATPTTNVAMMTEKPKVLNATHFQMPPDAAPEASKQEETTTNAATITEKPKVLNTTHLQMPPDAAPEASKLEETTTTAVSEVVTTGMDISEVVAPYLASPANETGEESEGKVNKTESKSTIASEISGVIVPDLNTTTSDSLSDIPTAPLTLGKTGSNTTIFQETNTTVAMVIDSVENVTSAF
ncbi:mucin-2-like [Liolophura sinensis]|uniref:mucin-2-like n=1 Tax=Liolophura sinensis TaxID=3198878 RepID=UPI0031586BA8